MLDLRQISHCSSAILVDLPDVLYYAHPKYLISVSLLPKDIASNVMQRLLPLLVVGFLTAAASTVSGMPLMYDVDDDDDAGSATQAGWIATNLGNVNNVTFTAVGSGLDDRDRGAGNGGGVEADMWNDFVFATGQGGIDVVIDSLSPNTTYDVRVWAYDDGNTGHQMTWNGVAHTIGATDPTTLMDEVVSFQAMTNPLGELLLEGRSVGTTNNNVFINGFELTAQIVPEPASVVIWSVIGVCFVGFGYCRVRRKK